MDRGLSEIPGADEALAFLGDAYRTRLRRAGRTVEHPVAVAGLLADDAQPPRVVVAGILNDVLEDTGRRLASSRCCSAGTSHAL